jgi:hypothetical protein
MLMTRFLAALSALAILTAAPGSYSAENDLADIKAEVAKRHDEAVNRLQDWIKQVSIAAEDRGFSRGRGADGANGAGSRIPAGGDRADERKPGVFATLDAGAARTVSVLAIL